MLYFVPAGRPGEVPVGVNLGGAVVPTVVSAYLVQHLVGADLTNIRAFRRLQARFLSIGGAGTFDGVFVAGVLAVLLAAIL